MSLREQLREILPEILPDNANEAIKGTELIRLVRFRLGNDYSDATLRYHFSVLSYDTTSPIAKVDQGQGYYFRIKKNEPRKEQIQPLFQGQESGSLESRYFSQFSSIVERHHLHQARYPFVFREPNQCEWDIPDLVITHWDFDTESDAASKLDDMLLNLKAHLGVPAVSLTALKLKLQINLNNCNAEFFQTLSATRWANQGELLIAEEVRDEALVDALRHLGHQFGMSIKSLGLDLSKMDDLPSSEEIRSMSSAEFESVQTLLKPQRIAFGKVKPHLDWRHLSSLKKKHPSIPHLIEWLNQCLASRQPCHLSAL